MPSVAYGTGAFQRASGNLPELVHINMFAEEARTSDKGMTLQSRPGLATAITAGTGPINGLFSKQGCYSGDRFSISNTTLYRETTNLGAIAGTGPASFAASATEVVVTRGGVASSYNGTSLANITFPDTANVRAVTYIGNLFVYVRDGTQKYYWSALLDGRTIDSLDFASAEREPDQLLDVAALGDNLWLFGQSTVEVLNHTGAVALPFTRFEQTTWDKGIYATGCVCQTDNALYWVGSDCKVYRSAEVPQRVSAHWLEEKLIAATSVSLFSYLEDGHEFVNVRTNTQSYALDVATGEWTENQTSAGQWIAKNACTVGGVTYFGNQTDGKIMSFSGWLDIAASLERRFSFGFPLDSTMHIDRLSLWCEVGADTTDNTVSLRLSDDAGRTFGSYEDETLGASTEYRKVPEWRALGMFDFPGVVGQIKCSADGPFRVSAVKINDPAGGRSRGL